MENACRARMRNITGWCMKVITIERLLKNTPKSYRTQHNHILLKMYAFRLTWNEMNSCYYFQLTYIHFQMALFCSLRTYTDIALRRRDSMWIFGCGGAFSRIQYEKSLFMTIKPFAHIRNLFFTLSVSSCVRALVHIHRKLFTRLINKMGIKKMAKSSVAVNVMNFYIGLLIGFYWREFIYEYMYSIPKSISEIRRFIQIKQKISICYTHFNAYVDISMRLSHENEMETEEIANGNKIWSIHILRFK